MELLMLLGMIGTAIGGWFAGEDRYKKEKADRDRMVAEERAYNSEEAQAKRLEGIGLNPFYHMSGGMSRTQAGTVVEAPNAMEGLATGLGFVNQIMDLNTAQIQQNLMNAQKNKLLAETKLLEYTGEGEDALQKWLNSLNPNAKKGEASAMKGLWPLLIQTLRAIVK